ncbi:sialidase family protein [Corynebacterium uterequi]|uniref:exo-alpha-sialidase n=1 Tax=Corynebacterium uterequi TaxID=1072256 RepID=A0A0G3HGR3_9CORY|nr:sialidase family protein [Corynebacterium uterequi]AKK10327.1 laminin G domain-containing protein [Corynebacterium uterequi]
MYLDHRAGAGVFTVPEAAVQRHGSLHLDFAATADAELLRASGADGWITLSLTGGRLDGEIHSASEHRRLDAEDAVGLNDGAIHSVTLTVNDSGTHLFVDGYEAFSATTQLWFRDLGIEEFTVDPAEIITVYRVAVLEPGLTPRAAVALAVAAEPFVEFAAAELSTRDVQRCSTLRKGAIRARFRTRGRGQHGVAVTVVGVDGVIRMGIDDGGNLYYRVWLSDELVVEALAEGRWDDGNDHDVVAVVGHGAVDLYADGYQVVHEPGMAFFADLGSISQVLAGMDADGRRLFGEVSEAHIFDAVLSDHQVKRLASVEPLETRALFDTGLLDSASYRIPSLVTLASGVVVAGADQRVSIPNDAPNDINFTIRRSLDGGRTWLDVQTVIEHPGSGLLGASATDSVLVQDRDTGRLFCVLDFFPGGIGQPNAALGRGFDDCGRRILHDEEGMIYLLKDDGEVLTAEGKPTSYRVASDGNVNRGGNIYLADGVDPNQTLLAHPTSYLQIIYSDDDGETWSAPRDITAEVKEEWMSFCGTSPGNGIQLSRGEHAGRILIPLYHNNEHRSAFSCAALYTDDGGQTWHRGASTNDGRNIDGQVVSSRDLIYEPAFSYESVFVEDSQGRVHVWMRNNNAAGRVAHAVSDDGGTSWGQVDFVDAIPEIFSQPNAIAVDVDGHPGIVFANASQLVPYRGRGVLRLSLDDGATWPHNRVFNPKHYVYQCMTQLPNGDIGLLWERERQGLFLSIVPLTWLTSSLQG